MRFVRVAMQMCAALLLGACDVSLTQERELGEQYAAQLDQQLRFTSDSALAHYVSELGTRIARITEREDIQWRFSVVESPELNAFAVPGGFVYVNRGLIERAGDMSELAGVLGHEVGHVVLRHSIEQMQKRTKTNVFLTLVCSFTDICASDVARVAIGVGGDIVFARYSRGDESEADSAAVEYLVGAGIDPRGVPRMFERLLAERAREPTVVDAWLGSHPLEESRIGRTSALVARHDSVALDRLQREDSVFEVRRALER
jgi:beta-barrel assembly-enhancing protease